MYNHDTQHRCTEIRSRGARRLLLYGHLTCGAARRLSRWVATFIQEKRRLMLNVKPETQSADKNAAYLALLQEIMAREKIGSRCRRPCLSCAKMFRPQSSQAESAWAFCSQECETTWQIEAARDCAGKWIQEHVAAMV